MRTAGEVGYVMFVPFDDQRLAFERSLQSFGSKSYRGSKSSQDTHACFKIYL